MYTIGENIEGFHTVINSNGYIIARCTSIEDAEEVCSALNCRVKVKGITAWRKNRKKENFKRIKVKPAESDLRKIAWDIRHSMR